MKRTAGRGRVLLVQENHLLRRAMHGLLLGAGYLVTVAEERDAVLALAREGTFDLAIVAVYRGSTEDTTEAVTALRQRQPPVPVLVSAPDDLFKELSHTGARRIVVRPPSTLLDVVEHALRVRSSS